MEKLKKDIEDAIYKAGNPNFTIIFEIKNNSHLVQMIEELSLAGYCENSLAWKISGNKDKVAFDSQSSDFIELGIKSKNVTYSSTTKFESIDKSNKVVLNTLDYLKKKARKKLVL